MLPKHNLTGQGVMLEKYDKELQRTTNKMMNISKLLEILDFGNTYNSPLKIYLQCHKVKCALLYKQSQWLLINYFMLSIPNNVSS